MLKRKQKINKGKPRAKPLSLYPLSLDEITEVLLHTPPLKNPAKKTRKSKEK